MLLCTVFREKEQEDDDSSSTPLPVGGERQQSVSADSEVHLFLCKNKLHRIRGSNP